MTAVELLAGLVYLLLGGDLLVRGAVALADRWGLSPMLVGVTIVAIGTSAPELVVSVQAALTGHPGIALGNVVGSNIANMLLVLGAMAIVCTIGSEDAGSRAAAKAMLAATVILVVLAWDGALTRLDGVFILAGLPLFLASRIRQVRKGDVDYAARRDGRIEWVLGHPSRTWMILVFLVLGGICLPVGAELLVGAAAAAGLLLIVRTAASRGLRIGAIQWALTVLWLLYAVFVAEVVIAFLREGMLKGAAVNGAILGFGAIVGAVLLLRFVFTAPRPQEARRDG